jgi:hypothetical protein
VTLTGADTCQWPHSATGSVVAYPAHGDLRAERDIACSMFPPRTAPAYPSNERNLGFNPWRGHGGVYDAISAGRIDAGRLRRALLFTTKVPLTRVRIGTLDMPKSSQVEGTYFMRPNGRCSPEAKARG